MCGIAGYFEQQGRKATTRDTLLAMLEAIEHRGPDDRGLLVTNTLAMGMQRLSIIDLAGGKQPIRNEDGTVAVVFNGEIYNYRDLQKELRTRGHRLSTSSDTEVIVHLYEEMGEECVQALRGMFSFAIWDFKRRRLFIARDRLGIKPLYYSYKDGRLIFGSEIKSILAHPEAEISLSLQALGHYISLKYVPAPETMFCGIHALPPGHTLTCDENEIRVRSYWNLSFVGDETNKGTEEDYAEQLQNLLRESVRLHLVSDVPFGAFLSGGVDSSTIVALMSQVMNVPVKTFSVGFQGGGAEAFSELPYARMVAERFATDHHEVYVTPTNLMDLAQKVVWHLDQPIADNACVANYMVSQLAAQHVKMVLTGEGGDELFAGYARYAGEKISSFFRYMPAPAKSLLMGVMHQLPGLRRLKIALTALCQTDDLTRLANWFPLFNRHEKPLLLKENVFQQLRDPFAEEVFRDELRNIDSKDWLSRMLYVDTKLWLPDDLLARGDKTSMATSLEARVPLLDHKLVEFAASLPSGMKVNGLVRKYLLKKVARKWLPNEIIDRKKEGFPMPFSLWFRTECRAFVHDLLSPETVRRRGLFQPDYVQRLLNEHDAKTADHGSLIWGLLSVELWHRAFLDSGRPKCSHHIAEPDLQQHLLRRQVPVSVD
ncbi:MAG TPA: asparagine synthase (glutamine-hydrolyzing) [Candidatus Aquilonibacter sp.]|nr:asparagine synthase (glutamine-hydrolyzing) [Candidatus Aquilonibacter sp.]